MTNGVKCEFTVSAAQLTASKFTIAEQGHIREMPMLGVAYYWFYLRDFITNSASVSGGTNVHRDLIEGYF